MTPPTTALPPFKSVRYAGTAPGPRLIVTGAVHGNEVCGTQAIGRVMAELDAGELVIAAGVVTFVPITNAKAYVLKQRAGDRNLNRALEPTATPVDYEDHVANWLCPLLAAHEVLLDLHSFQAQGRGFVMVGPRDNEGEVEPFSHAAQEEALVRCLGVNRAVDGWLGTYATGVARRRANAERLGLPAGHDLHPRYGVGTTEYMRSQGGWALTLECGQHADPAAPEVAWRAINHTLAHLGMIDGPPPQAVAQPQLLRLTEVIDKLDAGDRFTREWASYDPVARGDAIGVRHDGTPVVADADGYIVFPNPGASAGNEWFYFAVPGTRALGA